MTVAIIDEMEAGKQVAQLELERLLRLVGSPDIVPSLYHYTGAEGLYGIVESRSLHAGNVLMMNDATEVIYAKNAIRTVIDDEYKLRSNDRMILMSLFGEVDNDPILAARPNAMFFVVSFSEEKDDLSQWRAYGSGRNGFSLEFDFNQSLVSRDQVRLDQPFDTERNITLIKIVYGQELQIEVISQLLRASVDLYYRFELSGLVEHQTLVREVANVVEFTLLNILLKFKNRKFVREAEWRLVEARRHISRPGETGSFGKVEFKARNNGVTSYVSIKDIKHRMKYDLTGLPLSGVLIGPREEQHTYANTTKMFLVERGFHRAAGNISSSEVPIRF